MNPKHRNFIETIEKLEENHSIRNFVIHNNTNKELVNAYNKCLDGIHVFRDVHFKYAMNYINRQVEKSSPVETGTGGTPLVHYLKKHVEDVLNSKIASC
ncbi:MAG: hypothetical protein RCG15_04775 [Candidatus Rickettsia vulgarisii]